MQYTFVQKQYAHARYSAADKCDEFLCTRVDSDEVLALSAVELATIPNAILLITADSGVRRNGFTPIPVTVTYEISNIREDISHGT